MKNTTTSLKNQQFRRIGDIEQDFESSPTTLETRKNLSVAGSFRADNSGVRFFLGQTINRKAISGNYSIASTDYLVSVTTLVSAPTVGLPNPLEVYVGRSYIIKDEVGGAATTTITIRSDGERTIDGATSATITTNYGVGRYYSDGSNWFSW